MKPTGHAAGVYTVTVGDELDEDDTQDVNASIPDGVDPISGIVVLLCGAAVIAEALSKQSGLPARRIMDIAYGHVAREVLDA